MFVTREDILRFSFCGREGLGLGWVVWVFCDDNICLSCFLVPFSCDCVIFVYGNACEEWVEWEETNERNTLSATISGEEIKDKITRVKRKRNGVFINL